MFIANFSTHFLRAICQVGLKWKLGERHVLVTHLFAQGFHHEEAGVHSSHTPLAISLVVENGMRPIVSAKSLAKLTGIRLAIFMALTASSHLWLARKLSRN